MLALEYIKCLNENYGEILMTTGIKFDENSMIRKIAIV